MQNGGRGHIKQNNANFATENCGYPQKSFAKQTKMLILQKKTADIRKNLTHHDYDGIVFLDIFDFLLDRDSV
jgi:hypothetical protein